MNLSKNQIETLVKVGKAGDNGVGQVHNWDGASDHSLPLRLLEGKVLVDRWNNITTKIVFNTCYKDLVNKNLDLWARGKDRSYYHRDENKSHIWGADILFDDNISIGEILLFSNEDRLNEIMDPIVDIDDDSFDNQIDNGRAIAVIPMPRGVK